MKQIKKFTVDGQTVSVPQDELEEFQGAAAEHGAKPDEIKGFRVTVSDGRAHDVEVPASELEDFASEARERGATFEPIRTERMEDGSVRKMTVGELSRFLRSDEYLKSDDHEKSVAANAERGLEPGSVGWAGVSGFFRGLGEGALAGANAVSGQMMKAIPEAVLDIDAAAGRVLQGASKLGDNAVTRFAGRVGDATVATAEAAKAWLDGKIGSKTGDFLGYDDWSAKTADFIGNVAGMAYKFAPGMASNAGNLAATGTKAVLENGGKVLPQAASGGRLAGLFGGNFGAYMEAVFASDGINACANVYDLARESGATPEEASALGGEAFLLNYFGGRAMMRAGGLAEGIKNPVLKFLAGGEAVSDAMALQAAGNKRLENAATGRPLGEGVAEDFWSGKLEGWLFHGVNAVPGAVLTKFENREAYRRHEEFRGKKILELLKDPDGSAYLYQMLSSDELDAAIRARRGVNPGERRATGEEFKALAVKAGLPETMTLSEANRVVDALSDQRDALNARVRIRMDDFQASALSETVDEYAKTRGAELGLDEKGLAELFARTWLKAAEKVTDARDLDDPEIRKVVVEKAAREAGGEISRERETELAEKSRLRGASVAEQVREIASRRIVTWEDAESDELIAKDAQGRWTGGMRQALNIAINGTEKLKESVSEGRIDGDTAEGLITAAQCELGARPPEERATLIDRILDFADGDSGLARRIMDKLSVREAGNETPLLDDLKRIEDEVTRETEAGFLSDTDAPARAPETPYEGAVDAARLKGTELRSVNGGELACTRFPEVRVEISQDGIRVDGLTDALVSNPENGVDMAAFMKRLSDIHQRTGLPVDLGDANAKSAVDALIDEVNRGGLAKAQAKLETRAKLLGLLFRTTLGNGVTYDEGRFRTALEKSTNGRAFKDSHGNIYGFVDGDGVLHFNPAALNFNTPFHEYGHLALEALKGINRPLWERGIALVRESAYFREIKGYAETEGHEYSYLKGREDMIADEALATLIGVRGERLVQDRGLEAQLKAWLKEVWKAFKGALGVADLTEEQIEKMTLGEFVDTINAELLKGSEFGTRKRAPLAKSSVRAYDESDGSGANGLLRWKNDRGYLFALPVDLERTRPGGKVVLARDDANVTDWIEARLHGLELRLSEAGKVYVKGRNGFEGELAEIFGRYPTIGRNDGLAAQIAQETGRAEWSEATPEELVAGLLKDREGYRSWTEARAAGTGQDALAAREEEHYRNQAEGAAARRWQDSGMGVAEYIRDMAERGEPGFDVDWETAREIEHDRVTGLLKNLEDVGLMSVGRLYTGSAADYERPSLHYVGTGEGNQVYGWGLYASNRRGVAEDYAKVGGEAEWKKNGKPLTTGVEVLVGRALNKHGAVDLAEMALMAEAERGYDRADELRELREHGNEYKWTRSGEHLYEQTWFTDRAPGDESRLLKWYEPVSEKQMRMVEAQLEKEGYAKEEKALGVVSWTRPESKNPAPGNSVLTYKRNALDDGLHNGEWLYERLAEHLRNATPKAASEFLARAGIDGIKYPADSYGKAVKDGNKAGWNYVSFRDDNIRVDHKWTDGESRFSVGSVDDWRSKNYERRLAEGWTPRPDGVTPEELHALEAVVPERHHVGSEPHGGDVVLEAVYPPDYASAAIVRFVKQFNGNASDLSDVRKALYLIYGGHTHSRSRFEQMNRPELVRLDRAGREERQRRHDSLLERERKVYASRQAVQKDLGYPAYKSDARWQDLDAEYRRIHAERLSPSAGERAVSEENERRLRAHDETKDARFEAYRDRRVSEGWRLLDEVARRRAVSPLSAFVNGDESRFSVGSGPLIDKAAFVAGRVRVGATAEGPDGSRVSESTPGALAASRELSSQGTTPLNALGSARRMSLPISEMEHLRKVLTGDAHPAGVMGGRRVTRSAWQGKGGRLWLSADVFGTVDKTDRAREKERLKEHGFYRNEDPDWCATHLPGEIRAEYARSEDQLATQLENLASRRERGVEPGGQAVATQVYADELARIVLEMPRRERGVLGGIQTIGRAFRREAARAFGGGAAGDDSAKAEAVAFLDWASGEEMSGNLTMDALTNAMFGKWLVMPREMEARAPKWSQAVERTIANDARLRDAFEEVSSHFSDEQATGRLVERIRKQQSQETEAALKQLRADAQAPISAGSQVADAKEAFLVGFHDKFAPVTVRVDEKVKSYVKARREVLKRTTDPDERAAISAEIDLFMGEVGRRMHRLELSRTAYERGAYNEGLRYFIQSVALEDKASQRWGLTEEDRSLYLRLNRIIETQGRAASDGMSARQARIALDEMKARTGPAAWSKMEQYGREFFAIHERELLDDARLTTAFGKPFVDYLRTQVHYTATTRTFSVEELAKIDVERAKMRKLGVAGGDDIVSEMYAYAGANGAGEMTGETLWTAKMKGSTAAAQEVRSATWTKVDRLMQFLRRNQMVIDLREALVAAGVEGVRDLSRTDGATFPSDPKGRYGHINFVEGGEKRTLVVPRQIADAFKVDPDSAPWLTKANGFIRKLFIDWNPAYWAQNVKRNQDSIEKNMPGMRETYLKTALRAVAPGIGSTTDLVLQALVRNVPVAGALFGENTMLAYIPKAERFVRIIESPGEWQRDLWLAEDAGDLPKVQRLRDDFAGVMEMLRGNFLVAPEQAYSGPETSFAADALGKKGLKTLEQIERETAAKSKTRKFVDAVNVFQKNARQQVREDELAKISAYLHDRAIYGLERSVEESGLIVKQNVSIAEGERAGRLKRPLQWGVAQFFNMVEKGVVRHWKALKERPGETLVKDGKVWIGRFIGALLSSGVLMKLMLDDSDGDEEKAKKKYGFIYGYANAFHRAYQNCSEYVKENYNIVPIWNSADGMTSVILGGALTDEDKLIVPSADFAAWTIAHRMGIAGEPSLGKALANSTFKAITPDLQLAGPLVTFLRDTVQSIFIDNPTDYFRSAPVYDKDLHARRNDSWEMRGQFAAAVGARLWNDFGGRSFLTADVNGVDNGRGSAPETLETALRRIPVLSPALARMVKVQVGSPAKRGEAIREEKGRRQGMVRLCATKLVDGVKGGVWWHTRDPAGFERQIASWTKTYGLDAADVASIRAKYFNAFIQNTNREAFDRRDIRKLFIEGRKQGLTDSQLWVMLGEM